MSDNLYKSFTLYFLNLKFIGNKEPNINKYSLGNKEKYSQN
jgi:hypothetical protein